MISTGKGNVTELKLHREVKGGQRKPSRPGARLLLIICIIFLGYLTFSVGSQINQLHLMKNNLNNIQAQVEELKHKNASLREELKRIKSDSYVEEVAREQLGLVKPGETLVVPTQTTYDGAVQKVIVPPVDKARQVETMNVRNKNIYD